ncbi:MAG: SBBP repeat-containing protein [Pyrinomonadaceae bacterium]|nr:SBBP repeat-containing protein [Pyrinomonadaceae bacterium]
MLINNRSPLRSLLTLSLVVVLSAYALILGNGPAVRSESKTASTPARTSGIRFEENRGQFPDHVRFNARGGGGQMFLTNDSSAVFVVRNGERSTSTAVFMSLEGAEVSNPPVGSDPSTERYNYFLGDDPSRWTTDVQAFGSVTTENIYDGVSIKWYGLDAGSAEYDLIVAPNADPRKIEWRIEGARNVSTDAEGRLVIETDSGTIRQGKPVTYQEIGGIRSDVESGYRIRAAATDKISGLDPFFVSFEVGAYDPDQTLVIDPPVSLGYSTFLGGTSGDENWAVATNSSGEAVVCGFTSNATFPTTPGTYDDTHNGATDAIVTKFGSTGSSLIFSTYIGGNSNETCKGIALDSNGNIFITGQTLDSTTDFPTTVGAYDTTHNGSYDAYLAKLNSTGSTLVYSTLIGGSNIDYGEGVAVGPTGDAYITGYTNFATLNFPTTPGAFDQTNNDSANGFTDGFVVKFDSTGSSLSYSTYLGGSCVDALYSIAVDSTGAAYVTGTTCSTSYPISPGAYDNSISGGGDVVVTKLNPAGSALGYSTFIGGAATETGWGIALVGADAVITGNTVDAATDYPTTAGVFDTTHNGGEDTFVTRFNSTGTALVASTLLGGSDTDYGESISTDSIGNVYVAGYTLSSNYPVSVGAYDTTPNGTDDVFVTKLNPAMSSLAYSTFVGSTNIDRGRAIAVTPNGKAFVAGETYSTGFPTTPGAFSTTYNGNVTDGYLFSLNSPNRGRLDFDGDTKTDISIFRPSNGQWWLDRSTSGLIVTTFGNSSDKLTPADFTGDGVTDVAFYRPSLGAWFVLRSEDFSFYSFPFGASGDVPVPDDYDGDGKADAAVFRPSTTTWYIQNSGGGTTIQAFGAATDFPVPADYDGDGKADIAIFRPSSGQWWLNRSSAGLIVYIFGGPNDKNVQGDYTGDGKADVAIWTPANGNWYILRSEDASFYAFPFGASGDTPAPGDYDGDGKMDAGVFRGSNATWYLNRSTAGVLIQQFGASSDLPVPNAYVR